MLQSTIAIPGSFAASFDRTAERTIAPSWAAATGEADMSRPSLLRRPNSSLITQLAASLPSRDLSARSASTVS